MSGDVRWPASRFYWAVLDVGSLPKARRATTEQLGYLLEPFLPEPLEAVHATFVRVSPAAFVACVLPVRVLEKEVPPEMTTLGPESAPSFVPPIDVSRIDLLTGRFEPAALRRARRRWTAQVAAIAALALGMVICGLERRVAALEARRTEIAKESETVFRESLGYRDGRLPAELQLEAELRSLRVTRRSDVPVVAARDASVELSRVLAAWPEGAPARTESLDVGPDGMQLRAQVATNDDAQRLAQALAAVPTWRLELPGVQPTSGGVELRLQWTREEGP